MFSTNNIEDFMHEQIQDLMHEELIEDQFMENEDEILELSYEELAERINNTYKGGFKQFVKDNGF